MNVDMFICRTNLQIPQKITEHTDAVVINASDGKHQHPHSNSGQIYTIRRALDTLTALKLPLLATFFNRVVGSLVPALKTMGAEGCSGRTSNIPRR